MGATALHTAPASQVPPSRAEVSDAGARSASAQAVSGTGYAQAMHMLCTGYAQAMHRLCTGHAQAMHRPCTGHAQAVHRLCTGYAQAMHGPLLITQAVLGVRDDEGLSVLHMLVKGRHMAGAALMLGTGGMLTPVELQPGLGLLGVTTTGKSRFI